MHGTGGGGGGYVAKAVHFDSTQTLMRASAMTGVSDSPFGTIAFWAQAADWVAAATDFFLADLGNIATVVFLNGFNPAGMNFGFTNTAGTSVFNIHQTVQNLIDNQWYHFLISTDCNHGAGAKLAALYTTGLQTPVTVGSDNAAAFNIDWSTPNGFGVCATNLDTPTTIADFADFQIFPGLNLVQPDSTINLSDIRNFVSAAGKPVNPSIAATAYGQQAVLFSGDKDGFPINQGTGGSFTLTGTLTNASTSPSD